MPLVMPTKVGIHACAAPIKTNLDATGACHCALDPVVGMLACPIENVSNWMRTAHSIQTPSGILQLAAATVQSPMQHRASDTLPR